jgi:hypothetical protein
MGFFDALWHLLGFFAPAVGVGVFASLLCKLVWRRTLAAVPVRRLIAFSVAAGALASLGCLLVFGRDGTMAGYTALVLACAGSLWWAGLRDAR